MNRLVKFVKKTDWSFVVANTYLTGLGLSPIVGGIVGAYNAPEDDMGERVIGGMFLGTISVLFSPVILVGFGCNVIGKGLRKLKNK